MLNCIMFFSDVFGVKVATVYTNIRIFNVKYTFSTELNYIQVDDIFI